MLSKAARRSMVMAMAATGTIGCVSTPTPPETGPAPAATRSIGHFGEGRPSPTIVTVAESAPAKGEPAKETPSVAGVARPAYAQLETLPIDLPTVIRLVDSNSPLIGIARARVDEANARLAHAETMWLPNLSVGAAYNRFDGQTQNQRGDIFSVSRANLFGGAGATLTLDTAEAIYRPLIQRRVSAVEQFREQSTIIAAEFEAVSAYLDLVQVYAQLEVNADTLKKAESMYLAAKNAQEAKLDRTAGDVSRAQTEVLLRKTERIDLEGRVGAASARLGRLLQLQPNVKLVPTDSVIAPVTLVEPSTTLDQLISTAVANRPDLQAHREAIAAAWNRVRNQESAPYLPKIALTNQTGAFGGGLNDDVQNFKGRNALGLQVFWEIRNLGFGNSADLAERRAMLEQAQLGLAEAQARAMSEIVEAAQLAGARAESLGLSEQAVKEATELYRINKEGTFNVVDAKNLFDALRPLQAIQVLNQARQNYLNAVIDFNRAQYRLVVLTGSAPSASVAGAPAK